MAVAIVMSWADGMQGGVTLAVVLSLFASLPGRDFILGLRLASDAGERSCSGHEIKFPHRLLRKCRAQRRAAAAVTQ